MMMMMDTPYHAIRCECAYKTGGGGGDRCGCSGDGQQQQHKGVGIQWLDTK